MAKRKKLQSDNLFPAAAEEEDKDKMTAEDTENEEEDQAEGEEPEEDETAAAMDDDEEETAEEKDGETDPDAEDDDDGDEKPAAKSERARIAAILQSKHAKGRGKLARHLAFHTGMSAKDAVAALEKAPQAESGNSFKAAMGGIKNPSVGQSGGNAEVNPVVATLMARTPSRVIKPRSGGRE